MYLSLELLIAICSGEHSSPMNGRLTWCIATWQRLAEALVDESKVAQHVVTHQWLEETEKTATLFSGRKHSQFESQFLQTFSRRFGGQDIVCSYHSRTSNVPKSFIIKSSGS